jgi:hypothetical protein
LNPFLVIFLADVAWEIGHHLAYHPREKVKDEDNEENNDDKPNHGHHIPSFIHNPFTGDNPI